MTSKLPDTQYVTVGGVEVAYKVHGSGSRDILYFYGLGSHVDLSFDDPGWAHWLMSLTSLGRVIFFDRRGTGASDAVAHGGMPSWEEWTEDVGAVLDAAGSRQAVILASLDAGPIAMLFAGMHPGRVSGLCLANTTARFLVDDDYPIGITRDTVDSLVAFIETRWGKPEMVGLTNPTVNSDSEFAREFARRLRASATPRTAATQYRYILEQLDVRSVLPLIQAPTLVMHTTNNPLVPMSHGRYIAQHIPGAAFVEVEGRGVSLNDGQGQAVALDAAAKFLTGAPAPLDIDRVLTTVLFTDITASTERVAEIGDAAWHRLLDAHDRTVRGELQRFRGREINTTGDGFFVSFDGPARAIRCALAMTKAAHGIGLDIRVGIHSGECEIRGDDLAGLAVHIAARIGALAGPGEVVVSNTVVELVAGSGITFVDHGVHDLKGVPGAWKVFAVGA